MKLTIKDLREFKKASKRNYTNILLTSICFNGVTYLLALLSDINSFFSLLFSFGSLVCQYFILKIGFLAADNNRKITFKDLVCNQKSVFDYIYKNILLVLIFIPFFILFFLAIHFYTQIVFESVRLFNISLNSIDVVMGVLIIGIVIISLLALLVYIRLVFASMEFYRHPEKKFIKALVDSFKYTKGNVFKIIYFSFSFVGWFLLALLPFGIGLLFLFPYISLASVYYYLKISGEQLEEI